MTDHATISSHKIVGVYAAIYGRTGFLKSPDLKNLEKPFSGNPRSALIMKSVLTTVCGLLLAIGLASSAVADTIADFSGDYITGGSSDGGKKRTQISADGWDYLCNATSGIEDYANYASLTWSTTSSRYEGTSAAPYPIVEAGWVHTGDGYLDAAAATRYVITAYTVQSGEEGTASIANSSISLSSSAAEGESLSVYVKKSSGLNLINTIDVLYSNSPQTFDWSLGNLLAGDTVYVAIGATVTGHNWCDATYLSYQISSIPEPSSLILISVGLLSLLAYAWRKRK